MTCHLTDKHNTALTAEAKQQGKRAAIYAHENGGSLGAAREGYLRACSEGFDDQAALLDGRGV